MKNWFRIYWAICAIGLFCFCCLMLAVCTAPVQIHVRAEQWQCPAEVKNNDGTVDFHGCKKIDGDSPSDQEATNGEDKLEVSAVDFDPREN